jgi:hypothetical protein
MSVTAQREAVLKVTEAGDRMCFWVSSSRAAKGSQIRYKVDLTGMGGYGTCQCLDWAIRRCDNIVKKLPMGSREVLCKHVTAARNHFLNGLLIAMAKSEERR